MKLTIAFRDEHARRITYYLRRRYKSRAGLEKLARVVILKAVAEEAQKELDELGVVK